MTTYRKSTDCRSYRINYVFGHDACLDHRPCHTHRGYVPSSCNTCKENRRLWEPLSDSMLWWHRHLSMNCARLGGRNFGPIRSHFAPFLRRLCSTPAPRLVRVYVTPRPARMVGGLVLLRRCRADARLLGRLLLLAVPASLTLVGAAGMAVWPVLGLALRLVVPALFALKSFLDLTLKYRKEFL